METKTCTSCKVEKPVEHFNYQNQTKGIRQSLCKPCRKQYMVAYYGDKNESKYKSYIQKQTEKCTDRRNDVCIKLLKYLSDKKCEICGFNDIRALEFDHINPNEKNDTISNLLYAKMNWDAAVEEMKKCRILCSNCHSIHTAEQQGHRKMRLAKYFQNK